MDKLIERAMPSECQSAEWGVRAIKGPFKRLSVPLPADILVRHRIIVCCVHLYNFRTRFVGLIQIRTVYKDEGTTAPPWVEELATELDDVPNLDTASPLS